MTRQWRIEFEGAYYHILSRGNEQRNIFHDNEDRISFLEISGKMRDLLIYFYGVPVGIIITKSVICWSWLFFHKSESNYYETKDI